MHKRKLVFYKISNFKETIKNSQFIKNTATLAGGSTIAQILPLVFAPLISRLYTTSDFGVFGIFIAIYSILAAIVSLKFELAIMLPKEDSKAKSIVSLSLFSATIFSLFVFVLFLIFQEFFVNIFEANSLNKLLLFAPVAAFCFSVHTILMNWYNRKRNYKIISFNKILRNTNLTASNIILGFAKTGQFGLVFSQVIADFISATFYFYQYLKKELKYKLNFNFKESLKLVKEYSRFPKYTLPAAFIDTFSAQLPVLLIATLYSQALSGTYFFAYRILAIPIALIGTAFAQTFFQKFVSLVNNSDYSNALSFIKKTWLLLFSIIVFPTIAIIFKGQEIFTLVFGNQWTESGKVASILIIYIMIAFVSTPTSSSYIALGLQKYSLIFSIVVISYRFLTLYLGYMLNNFYLGLILLVVFEAIQIFIFNFIIVLKLRKRATIDFSKIT